MYLKRLKLKNYRLFQEIDVPFQKGMNVLIGKNSSGKSTVLEAIDFLLSSNNANVPAKEIVPYDLRSQQNVQSCVEGFFEMSDMEKKGLCSILNEPKDKNSIEESHLELVYTKTISKSSEGIIITPNVRIEGNGMSKNENLLNQTVSFLMPKLQMNNVLKITDMEDNNIMLPLLPPSQLRQMFQFQQMQFQNQAQQQLYLNQYLRSKFYETKQENSTEFSKIKESILQAYPEMEDLDIEFEMEYAQIQTYFKKNASAVKIPLESEGRGIKEFFYLLLALHYFPDALILKDEALTHLHKSLLNNFVLAIEGLKYQMITTSHIKELIESLDFGNIIVCRKSEDKAVVENLMKMRGVTVGNFSSDGINSGSTLDDIGLLTKKWVL